MSYNSLKQLPPELFSAYFPNLKDKYDETSEETDSYNCVAYILEIDDKWIDSYSYYWPDDLKRGDSPQHYAEFFKRKNYDNKRVDFEKCDKGNFEKGIEKIAIFQDKFGNFTHVAIQLENENWSSKMGDYEDIIHYSLEAVGKGDYGEPVIFMQRKREKQFTFPSKSV